VELTTGTVQSGAGSGPVGPAASSRFCLFTLGEESFAVDLTQVSEVFRLESITSVPGMPSSLVGVANLRGTVVPLADLRPLLGMPRSLDSKYAVIVRHGARLIGILIDEVPEIHTVHPDDVEDGLSDQAVPTHPFLSGLVKVNNRRCGLVEVSRLLAVVEETSNQQAA
jgi:purine-binding chemotaxis protein CheW